MCAYLLEWRLPESLSALFQRGNLLDSLSNEHNNSPIYILQPWLVYWAQMRPIQHKQSFQGSCHALARFGCQDLEITDFAGSGA